MLKALIFLDIDGTLLDENYACNDVAVKEQIRAMQNDNITFCLNSNRSLEDLLPVAKQFSIDGLIIGENGIFAYDASEKSTEYLVTTSHLAKFTETKRLCERLIKDALEEIYPDNNVSWADVDTVSRLSHRGRYTDMRDGDIVALNNIYRRYTNSVHILRWRDNELHRLSATELQKIVTVAKSGLQHNERVEFAFSEPFSNILTYPQETTKRRAVKKVMKNPLYKASQVYVIGDELNDFQMSEGIGAFYTTGNAPDQVKDLASRVASQPYAKGVLELLKYIHEQS